MRRRSDRYIRPSCSPLRETQGPRPVPPLGPHLACDPRQVGAPVDGGRFSGVRPPWLGFPPSTGGPGGGSVTPGPRESLCYTSLRRGTPQLLMTILLASPFLANAGEITFQRFRWWGPHAFSYVDKTMEVEFRLRKLTQIVPTGRVLVERDAGPVPLLTSITPYSAPSNSKRDEKLRIEPKGRHFEIWNRYRPPEHLADRYAPVQGGVRLGPSAGEIGVWVTWSGAAKRARHVDACAIDFSPDIGAFSLRLFPSGATVEQTRHTSKAHTAWVATADRGAVAAVLERDGAPSALPDIVVSPRGKARRIAFRLPKPGTDEAVTVRWRIYVSGDPGAGEAFSELATRHAVKAEEGR